MFYKCVFCYFAVMGARVLAFLFVTAALCQNFTRVDIVIEEYDYLDHTKIPAHWLVKSQSDNSSVVVSLRCPSEYYSDGGKCVPCVQCVNGHHESRKCGPYLDRQCGPGVRIEVFIEGVGWVDAGVLLSNASGFSSYVRAGLNVSEYRECLGDTTYNGRDCVPCAKCLAHELEVRGCGTWHDRVCLGHAEVSVVIEGAVNISGLDVELLRQRLIERMRYNFSRFNYSIGYRSNHSLSVRPVTCPVSSYLNTSTWTCYPCTVCGFGRYYLKNCSLTSDARCGECTVCKRGESLVSPCSRFADAKCHGSIVLDIQLFGAFGVDESMLAWLFARIRARNFSVARNYSALARQCSEGQFLAGSECRNCSKCGNGSFVSEECQDVKDTVCEACKACSFWEYEACPCRVTESCPTGERLCYAYPSQNITLLILGGSREVWFFHNLVREFGGRGYLILQSNLQNLTVTVFGAVYQIPKNMVDFSPHVTRAMVNATRGRRLLHVTVNATHERRLLQACGADFFVYNFPNSLGAQCIPCQCSPNAEATEDTPLLLRYFLDNATCEGRWACDGYNKVCVPSQLVGTVVIGEKENPCPKGQELVAWFGLSACVGLPCQDGQEGAPGFCTDCEDGAVKTGVGPGPCEKCEVGFYETENTCRACPGNSTSVIGGTSCFCLDGYVNYPMCAACLPGQFKNHLGVCELCPAGSYNLNYASRCSLCEPGSFSGAQGSTQCSVCEPGATQWLGGSSACVDCAPGGYEARNASSSQSCFECEPGTFSKFFGASHCQACPPGKISNYGAVECLACLPGTFSTGGGSVCHYCAKNSYSGMEFGFCYGCSPGSYSLVASTSCERCSVGQGAILGGCEYCDEGYREVAGVCLPCEAGTFSMLRGSVQCYTCQVGSHSQPGQSQCYPCPLNTFGRGCRSCEWGKVTFSLGSLSCEDCPEGSRVGPGFCKNCPRDTFAQNFTCRDCPKNTASSPGSTRLSECMAKEGYWALPGADALKCPRDHYCILGSMRPEPCGTGQKAEEGSRECYEPVKTELWLSSVAIPIWVVVCCLCGVGLSRRRRILLRPKISVKIER